MSQSCLPEGIHITHQAQINNFQIYHPNCTEIEGSLYISGDDISNLNGLNVLTSVGGDLQIQFCNSLHNLTGLQGITQVGGELDVGYNFALDSFSGLDNLISIGGDFYITTCDGHSSFSGMNKLAYIGGDLNIDQNYGLEILTGLENLDTINGSLIIFDNILLNSLSGLSNLKFVGGDLIIKNNDSLESLDGIDNISASSIQNIYIYYNSSLSDCAAQSIGNYLMNPGGSVNIYENAAGCNNPPEIANASGISLPCLPFGNYYFISQTEIDNFYSDYLACNEINGNVKVYGKDISNLNGLTGVSNISGNINILAKSISDLSGLDSLQTVGGDFEIYYCDALPVFQT